MVDDIRSFNPIYFSVKGGVIKPTPRVNPTWPFFDKIHFHLTFFRPNFILTKFFEKNVLTSNFLTENILLPIFFLIWPNFFDKNFFNQFFEFLSSFYLVNSEFS